MELLSQVEAGFHGIPAEEAAQGTGATLSQAMADRAFLRLSAAARMAHRRQQWAGLLDRFYQILPFGTGGRRGAVGIGPNRMNLLDARRLGAGPLRILCKERFPGVEPLHVVLAYDVRQFEDQRRQYNPALPNPVLHLSSARSGPARRRRLRGQRHPRLHPPRGQQALPGHAGTVVHHPLAASARRAEHLGVAQSARRQRRQVLRRARRPAGAARRPDHGRPRGSGDDDQAPALARGGAVRPHPLPRRGAAPGRTSTCAASRAWSPPPRSEEFKVVFTPLHGVGAHDGAGGAGGRRASACCRSPSR